MRSHAEFKVTHYPWFSDSASSMEGYESTGDYVVHDPVHPTHWAPLLAPPGA